MRNINEIYGDIFLWYCLMSDSPKNNLLLTSTHLFIFVCVLTCENGLQFLHIHRCICLCRDWDRVYRCCTWIFDVDDKRLCLCTLLFQRFYFRTRDHSHCTHRPVRECLWFVFHRLWVCVWLCGLQFLWVLVCPCQYLDENCNYPHKCGNDCGSGGD